VSNIAAILYRTKLHRKRLNTNTTELRAILQEQKRGFQKLRNEIDMRVDDK
jgi:hypothetical protein